MARFLAITLTRSTVGRPENQRRTAYALGLRKMHKTAVHADTETIRGMVNRIRHLVTVEEIEQEVVTE
ncbi:MAG: 50S ribosomal protein L30 [Alicyclobacillaceae bacterium]|jgi:large subunit ribosomal protein L30|uniref:50S ribosomal protein L30 n=1 Tax=Alicyclobacillus sp. SP_1 TaxID=2942475 RepID=UPI002157CEA0|nr:50S ribosomal protein L30 [Alicyclobacillus sp. SP_1]MCY0887413.1 50S ribosomal protein L30 [Alicyclobacillaceae bacterium]MCY0895955.1 50S ribosomal protein L30 [Alicyclobacillaceae bacterium]